MSYKLIAVFLFGLSISSQASNSVGHSLTIGQTVRLSESDIERGIAKLEEVAENLKKKLPQYQSYGGTFIGEVHIDSTLTLECRHLDRVHFVGGKPKSEWSQECRVKKVIQNGATRFTVYFDLPLADLQKCKGTLDKANTPISFEVDTRNLLGLDSKVMTSKTKATCSRDQQNSYCDFDLDFPITDDRHL